VFVSDLPHRPESGQLVAELAVRGHRAETAPADLTNGREVAELFEQMNRTGGIHSIVHAAAPLLIEERLRKVSWASFQKHWDVGVGGAFNLVRAWLSPSAVVPPEALVLVLSSVTLGMPPTGHAAYTSAKYALLGLARSLAVELASRGTTVNCVSPGMLGAGMTLTTDPRIQEVVARATPLGRLPSLEDVSGTVAFLVGPEARFITGLNVPITGGAGI
jgi:3-oxoacyl-[acyl-carrier protein] reductase